MKKFCQGCSNCSWQTDSVDFGLVSNVKCKAGVERSPEDFEGHYLDSESNIHGDELAKRKEACDKYSVSEYA